MWGLISSQASLNGGYWYIDTGESSALRAWEKALSHQSRSWLALSKVLNNLHSSSSLRVRTLCRFLPCCFYFPKTHLTGSGSQEEGSMGEEIQT